jgi:hypothetical protein
LTVWRQPYHPWYTYGMLHTETHAPATSAPALDPADLYVEILLCADCAIVIANGDSSGIEDADTHLAKMDAHLAGYAVVTEEADLGFHADTCGGCGDYLATDQWFHGIR